MAKAISHHLLEPEVHQLVAQDGQTREAHYRTVWDDGRETETIHRLYWFVDPIEAPDGEVRSEEITA